MEKDKEFERINTIVSLTKSINSTINAKISGLDPKEVCIIVAHVLANITSDFAGLMIKKGYSQPAKDLIQIIFEESMKMYEENYEKKNILQ